MPYRALPPSWTWPVCLALKVFQAWSAAGRTREWSNQEVAILVAVRYSNRNRRCSTHIRAAHRIGRCSFLSGSTSNNVVEKLKSGTGNGAAEFLGATQASRLEALEKNWTQEAPLLLDYNYTVDAAHRDAVSSAIRARYFGEQPIARSTAKQLIAVGTTCRVRNPRHNSSSRGEEEEEEEEEDGSKGFYSDH